MSTDDIYDSKRWKAAEEKRVQQERLEKEKIREAQLRTGRVIKAPVAKSSDSSTAPDYTERSNTTQKLENMKNNDIHTQQQRERYKNAPVNARATSNVTDAGKNIQPPYYIQKESMSPQEFVNNLQNEIQEIIKSTHVKINTPKQSMPVQEFTNNLQNSYSVIDDQSPHKQQAYEPTPSTPIWSSRTIITGQDQIFVSGIPGFGKTYKKDGLGAWRDQWGNLKP